MQCLNSNLCPNSKARPSTSTPAHSYPPFQSGFIRVGGWGAALESRPILPAEHVRRRRAIARGAAALHESLPSVRPSSLTDSIAIRQLGFHSRAAEEWHAGLLYHSFHGLRHVRLSSFVSH